MRLLRRSISVVVVAVLLFLLLNSPAVIARSRPLEENLSYLPSVKGLQTPLAQGLHISRIGLQAPIHYEVEATDEERLLIQLQTGIAHLRGTARPGEWGNTVIVGHSSNYFWEQGNYNTVFAPLHRLTIGDFIQIQRNSELFVYQIVRKEVVAPTELSVLQPTDVPTLTLITCSPIGTTWRRLVIRANQLSPDPTRAEPFAGTPLTNTLPGPR